MTEPVHEQYCARLGVSGEFIFPDTKCTCGAAAVHAYKQKVSKLGGAARAKALSPRRRRQIARAGGKARWKKRHDDSLLDNVNKSA